MATPTLESLGFPVDTAVCFSDHKGAPRKGIEKRQLTWLSRLAPLLRTLLRPGEKVLLAVPACSPMSIMEQWTTGWVIYYIKRCQLVVTDQRILELAVRRDLGPRFSACEIEHGGVAEARVSSFLSRSLRLRYRDGRTDVFPQVDAGLAAKLRALLPPLVAQAMGTSAGSGRQHLCPRCAGRLDAPERCPRCFLEFKTRAKAVKYSLLFPGGGYFYTGHPVMGVMDALVELMLIVLVASAVWDVLKAESVLDAAPAALFFAGVLAVEKLLSIYHAGHYVKEYLPVEAVITPVRAA